jgi:hypothetical protein
VQLVVTREPQEWDTSLAFMDYYCAGYWNLSSFLKVFPRFFIPSFSEFDTFFFFSGWNPVNLQTGLSS